MIKHKQELVSMLNQLAPIGRTVYVTDPASLSGHKLNGKIAGLFGIDVSGSILGWVEYEFGNVAAVPHHLISPTSFEITKKTENPMSWRDVAIILLKAGWTVNYRPLIGHGPWEWRSPNGTSGSDYRSYSCESAPDAVMQEAYKSGHIWFTALVR